MRYIMVALIVLATTTPAHADDARRYVVASAAKFGVAPMLALRIAKAESGIRCNVVGSHGEVGPLQILPSSARALGYRNIRGASCRTKTDAGMKHLALCYRGAHGDWHRAAACHNAGVASLRWRHYPARVNHYVRMVMR